MKRLIGVAAVLAAALMGCGGGSSATPAAIATLAPASIPMSVRRSDIQVALTSVQTSTLLSQFGAATNTTSAAALGARHSMLRALRDARARRTIAAVSACTNSTTEDFTSTGPGTGNLVETRYYDTACTQKYEVIAAVVNGSAATVDGTLTIYDQSGNATTNDTIQAALTVSAGVDRFTVSLTPAEASGTNAGSAVDLTCSLSTTASTLTCGAAGTTTLAEASMIGASLALRGSSANVPNGETVTFSASANAYTGGPGALSLTAGSGDAWNIVGGTLVASESVSENVTSSTSGLLTALTLTVNDATYFDTVSLNESSAGISLREVLGTTTLATATLDLSGNGVIMFADGSQDTVRNYTIVA